MFWVPGGQTLALYDGILDREPALRHVLVRDERTAAYAADAYARVTGLVGVCDATVGPGAAKLPSGLAEALGASVPVIALVSELPARLAPHRYRSAASQALDQASLLAPVTKWQALVPDAAAMPALVGQAFRMATTGRPGPVALFLPQDVLDGPADKAWPAERAAGIAGPAGSGASRRSGRCPTQVTSRRPPRTAPVGPPTDLLAWRRRHALRRRPCGDRARRAVVGRGRHHPDRQGRDPRDHPLSVGVAGSMGAASATAALAEADVVLLIGSKASGGATANWSLPRSDQAVLQLDLDPAELGRAFPLEAGMLGDAQLGLLRCPLRWRNRRSPSRTGPPGGSGWRH